MFMFRSKRHTLVKQLWKYAKEQQQQRHAGQPCEGSADLDSGGRPRRSPTTSLSASKIKTIQTVLKRLKEKHLETLLRAVETDGLQPGACVPVTVGEAGSHRDVHLLITQVFRWPDVKAGQELKRLPICKLSEFEENESQTTQQAPPSAAAKHAEASECCVEKASDFKVERVQACNKRTKLYECCNPYHWSRLFQPRKCKSGFLYYCL